MGNIISSCRNKNPKCKNTNSDQDSYTSKCAHIDTTQLYQNFNHTLYNNCLENLFLENKRLRTLAERNSTQDFGVYDRKTSHTDNIANRNLYKTKSLSEVFLDKPISITIDFFGSK